jgi:hexosaminidase
MIDALSYDRANVLHWHMTDAQSFPLLTPSQQNLSLGAWGPAAIYTLTDVENVVTYARFRGVAVVVEIDTPSHVQSWANGRPDIVLNDTVDPYWSLLNPILNATYDTYRDIIFDLRSVLIDNRFHLGLDEVQFPVLNVSAVNAWMAANGMQAGDYAALVRYYMQNIQSIVLEAGFTYPLWWCVRQAT